MVPDQAGGGAVEEVGADFPVGAGGLGPGFGAVGGPGLAAGQAPLVAGQDVGVLLEGRVDGDALMFSRDLTIEGDVEAVLALRNAIDDTQLDLAGESGSLFGPFGRSIERILDAARGVSLRSGRSQDGIR